jgi:hypothetical protein
MISRQCVSPDANPELDPERQDEIDRDTRAPRNPAQQTREETQIREGHDRKKTPASKTAGWSCSSHRRRPGLKKQIEEQRAAERDKILDNASVRQISKRLVANA